MSNEKPPPAVDDGFWTRDTGPLPENIFAAYSHASCIVIVLFGLNTIRTEQVEGQIQRLVNLLNDAQRFIKPIIGKLTALHPAPFEFPGVKSSNAHAAALELAQVAIIKLRTEQLPKLLALTRTEAQSLIQIMTWEAIKLAEQESGEVRRSSREQPVDSSDNAEPSSNENSEKVNDGMSWEDAAERLERLRLQGEPFSSQHNLASQLGCSSGTINKAIRLTPALHTWAKLKGAAAPRAQSLNGVVTDQTPQRSVPDPFDEAAIREYIENADSETRAWFLALSHEVQIEVVNDPDKHQRILGRKP